MKIKATTPQHDVFPSLDSDRNARQRLSPPTGSVKHQSRARNMSMAVIGGSNPLLPVGVMNVIDLKFITDEIALANATSSRKHLDEISPKGLDYVVTSFYRDPATDKGDHGRGLAIDVSYGDYDQTHAAFAILMQTKSGVLRQLIFENVRGTPRGYHIHLGFYAPDAMGIIESALYYSAKAVKAGTFGKDSPYVKLRKVDELPGKEYFENA